MSRLGLAFDCFFQLLFRGRLPDAAAEYLAAPPAPPLPPVAAAPPPNANDPAQLRNEIMSAKTPEQWYDGLAWLYGGSGLNQSAH